MILTIDFISIFDENRVQNHGFYAATKVKFETINLVLRANLVIWHKWRIQQPWFILLAQGIDYG